MNFILLAVEQRRGIEKQLSSRLNAQRSCLMGFLLNCMLNFILGIDSERSYREIR